MSKCDRCICRCLQMQLIMYQKQAGRSRECVIHREKEYDYVYGLKKTLKEKSTDGYGYVV